jgi:hypothetical protein
MKKIIRPVIRPRTYHYPVLRYTLSEAGYAVLNVDRTGIADAVQHPRARARWVLTDAGRAALDDHQPHE